MTAIAVAAVLMLAGCSTTTGGAGGGDPAAAGDKLTAAGTYPIESLDPHGAQGATTGTQLTAQAIFSRLVRPASDGKVEGDLAEKWEAGATAAEWTFHLRSGVTFSDGKPMAAADVVASFDRMMSLDGPNATTIIKQLYPRTGALSDSLVAPAVLGYAKQQPVTHDTQAAKAAPEAAGFDFSKKLRLQFSDTEFRPFVQAVASGLAEAGVQVDVPEKEKAVFTEDLLALNWDIDFQQLATPTYDAASNLGRLYTCAAKRTGYCTKELDKLLAKAGASPDEAERAELYGQAGKIIWEDAVGMYPMTVQLAYSWRSRVTGFTPDPSGLPDFSHVLLAGA